MFLYYLRGKSRRGDGGHVLGAQVGSGEVIRTCAPYTSRSGSFVLFKMDRIRVVWGGNLSILHRPLADCFVLKKYIITGMLSTVLDIQTMNIMSMQK